MMSTCNTWDIIIPIIIFLTSSSCNIVLLSKRVINHINSGFYELESERETRIKAMIFWLIEYAILCLSVMDIQCSIDNTWQQVGIYMLVIASMMCLMIVQVVYVLEYHEGCQAILLFASEVILTPMIYIGYKSIFAMVGLSLYLLWVFAVTIFILVFHRQKLPVLY